MFSGTSSVTPVTKEDKDEVNPGIEVDPNQFFKVAMELSEMAETFREIEMCFTTDHRYHDTDYLLNLFQDIQSGKKIPEPRKSPTSALRIEYSYYNGAWVEQRQSVYIPYGGFDIRFNTLKEKIKKFPWHSPLLFENYINRQIAFYKNYNRPAQKVDCRHPRFNSFLDIFLKCRPLLCLSPAEAADFMCKQLPEPNTISLSPGGSLQSGSINYAKIICELFVGRYFNEFAGSRNLHGQVKDILMSLCSIIKAHFAAINKSPDLTSTQRAEAQSDEKEQNPLISTESAKGPLIPAVIGAAPGKEEGAQQDPLALPQITRLWQGPGSGTSFTARSAEPRSSGVDEEKAKLMEARRANPMLRGLPKAKPEYITTQVTVEELQMLHEFRRQKEEQARTGQTTVARI